MDVLLPLQEFFWKAPFEKPKRTQHSRSTPCSYYLLVSSSLAAPGIPPSEKVDEGLGLVLLLALETFLWIECEPVSTLWLPLGRPAPARASRPNRKLVTF